MVSKAKRHQGQPFPAGLYAPASAMPALPDASRIASFVVLHDKNASVANVEFGKFKASGSAKREPGDVHDEEIGELIAAARAFQNLSRQLMSEANRRVTASTQAQREAQRRSAAKKAAKADITWCSGQRRTKEEWDAELRKRHVREPLIT